MAVATVENWMPAVVLDVGFAVDRSRRRYAGGPRRVSRTAKSRNSPPRCSGRGCRRGGPSSATDTLTPFWVCIGASSGEQLVELSGDVLLVGGDDVVPAGRFAAWRNTSSCARA